MTMLLTPGRVSVVRPSLSLKPHALLVLSTLVNAGIVKAGIVSTPCPLRFTVSSSPLTNIWCSLPA